MDKKLKELVKKAERALEREEGVGDKRLRGSVQKLLKELLAKVNEKDALKEKVRSTKATIETKSADLGQALRGYRKSLPKVGKSGKRKGKGEAQGETATKGEEPATFEQTESQPHSKKAVPENPELT